MIGNTNELNFRLDEDPGVSNTFDIPTYDYHTLLSHNIYYNLNSRSKIVIEDGNASRVGLDQNRKWFTSDLFFFNSCIYSNLIILSYVSITNKLNKIYLLFIDFIKKSMKKKETLLFFMVMQKQKKLA